MLPVTKPRKTYINRRALQKSNVSGKTSKRTGNLPDLDSDATMKVCRVCLAMNVKMFNMLGLKLSDMYERVTGVEVKAVDKLPKMLCCQCIAGLSSANNFIEKSQKTHQLLIAKIQSSRAFVTIRDIKSIDKAQYQLESLGFKVCKENDSSVYIKKGSDTSNDHHNTEYYNYYEGSGADFCEDNIVTNSEEVQRLNTEDNIHVEVPIKSEYLDPSDEQNEADENNKATNIKDENVEIKIQELVIVKQEYIDPSDEQNEADQNNRATDIGETKFQELDIVKQEHISDDEQATDNNKDVGIQLADQLSNDNGTVCNSLIKKEIVFVESGTFYANTIEEDKHTHFKEETNISDPEYTSDITSDSTSSDDVIIKNMKNNTNSSKDLFICDICEKHFNVKNILIQHIKNHSKSKLFSCANCKYETYNKRYLTAHINSMHPKEGIFCCKYCSYKTHVKRSLNRHIKRKHINSLFNCEYCSHVTHSKMLLKEHINAKHTKKDVYYCTDCHYKTYKKGSLDSHIKVKHTKKIVYNCPKCCFKTYNKGYIKYHVDAQHIKATSFVCTFCDYSSHVKRNFIRHVNARHSKLICQE